jgi:hypothetical protein
MVRSNGPGGVPSVGPVREAIVIDDNRAFFDHPILLAHRNDDSTTDEELYDTPQQSTKMQAQN